jgi:hypothetical protein
MAGKGEDDAEEEEDVWVEGVVVSVTITKLFCFLRL